MAKTVLRIPSICGIYGFESIARRQPLVSLANYETVEFDFSGLSGISILPLSIIFGWMSFLRKKQINVYARFPTNESDHHLPQALSRMHLAHALSAINVRHVGVLPRYSGSGLAAFKTFDGLMDLQAYKNSMESATTRKSLVGASDEIEFVNTGDFRNILLHELGENAFDHGKGEHVRFALCEYRRPVEQRSDGFLPQFDEPFIEMVVSDSGPGIATTLRSSFPSNWKPEYVGSQALSRGARICAYALEFSSTSQQAKRKNRLSQLMADAGDFVNVVPTGLYYVATVVRHYCGQLIVRTGQTFVCFDYTNPANPRVHENSQTSKHSDIPGTHILARIPRNRSSKPSNYPPIPNTGSATNYDLADPRTILLADLWTKSARAPADFILLFEQEVERILASYPAKRKRVLVVLANGLDADTKSVSLILTWLGTIPRREWIIFVAGLPLDRMPPTRLQSQTIESMLPGQNPIASVHRFQAWQSYLITTEDLSESLVFGGSKHVSDLHVMSRGMYLVALKVAIRNKIESAPIKHIERPNRFYLLQGGKYYTQKFYEIGQLVSTSNTSGLAFATAYVTHLLKQHNISTVINLAPPLMEFATHIATCTPTVKVIVSPPNNSMADVIQALRQHKSSGRLLLITDVICTGEQFRRYLSAIKNAENVRIFCFVDGRQNEKRYITVEGPDRAHSVAVDSALAVQILPLKDLRRGEDLEILLVDRVTHTPTIPDEIGQLHLDPLELVDIAAEQSDALFHGHIVHAENHFVDFIHLPNLFRAMEVQLDQFWSRIILRLERESFSTQQVSVLYLDEGRGWEELVPNSFSTKRVLEIRRITRNDFEVPRPAGEWRIKGEVIWFVLPVIASGETVRRCLQFATTIWDRYGSSASSPPRIVISVLIGRMPPQELNFYRNISGYKGASVELEVLGYFPIPAYKSQEECPVCTMLRKVSLSATQIPETYPLLKSFINKAIDSLRGTPLEHVLDRISDDNHTHPKGLLAKMRSLYELGQKDANQRKRLDALLQSRAARLTFVEMVGTHCDSSLFSPQKVRDVLYDSFDQMQEDVANAVRNRSDYKNSLRFLIGVHHLFPELFQVELKWLCNSACTERNSDLLASILFTTLLDPDTYGPLVAVGADIATQRNSDLTTSESAIFIELQKCPYLFGAATGGGIAALEKMIWLLRRSTSWGSAGIEDLRSWLSIRDRSNEEFRSRVRSFELNAVAPLLSKWAELRLGDHGSALWRAIESEGGTPNANFSELVSAVDSLRQVATSESSNKRLDLLRIIERMDNIAGKLISDLERVYTNVQDIVAMLKAKISEAGSMHAAVADVIDIQFSIAPDQPGVLFAAQDLTHCLTAFFENANDFLLTSGSPRLSFDEKLFLEFKFAGVLPPNSTAVLEIRDNIPYTKAMTPTGGLKQVGEYCRTYGARATFDLQDDTDPLLKARIHFRIDESRRTT